MEFDIFTFIAQIVNFIILVVLLRIFLYKRIIDAMDAREAKIASRLQEAEERESSARDQEQELKAKNRELDEKKDEMLAEAKEEAEKRRKELLKEAENEVEEKRKQWLSAVEEEKEEMIGNIRELTADSLLEVVRRIVNDLAGEELQQQIVHTFIHRLSSVPDEERDNLKRDVIVRSSFSPTDNQQEMIEKQILQMTDDSGSVSFETDDDMSFGIEISSKSVKISWTLDSYINSLRDEMKERFADEIEESE